MIRTFLSWRYFASRLTNWIGVAGIAVAVGALILILSIMTGFLDQSRLTIRGGLADLVVAPEHAVARADGREIPSSPDRILEVVRADPRVAGASAHLVWPGIVVRDSDVDSATMTRVKRLRDNIVHIVGIDPGDEPGTTEFREALERTPVSGQRVADPDDPFALPPGWSDELPPLPVVLLGDRLMGHLHVGRGSILELATFVPTPEGSPEPVAPGNRRFVVGGSFRTRDTATDLERVYVDRWDLQALIGDRREYSEVLVRVVDYEADAEAVARDLFAGLRDLGLIAGLDSEVRTWEEYRSSILGAIENERVMMAIMLFLVLLVAGFTVFAILSMMVTEKTRDIGVLTAVGATPRHVLAIFLLIGFWDAVIGTTIGGVAGVLGALNIDSIEQTVSGWIGVDIFARDLYLFDHIPSRVEPGAVTAIIAGAFVCSLVCAAIPAWRASRTDPVKALRYE